MSLEPVRRIETPAEIDVVMQCPNCGAIEAVGAKITTRLVMEKGAGSKLSVRARSLPLAHACDQTTLADLARDQGDD